MVPEYVTAAGTSLPAPWARSRKLEESMVLASIGSLNWAWTFAPASTPVALALGLRWTIVGAVVSVPAA